MEVRLRWLQHTVREGRLTVKKVPGDDNVADLLTKPGEANVQDKHCSAAGLEHRGGRTSAIPCLSEEDDDEEEEMRRGEGDEDQEDAWGDDAERW